MNSIVITKNLVKKFPTKEGLQEVVRGVNLEVYEKEIFGFLGPNGAGKTTTLRMLTTLLAIDAGEAIVANYNVQKQPQEVRKRIGYVSQEGGADRNATGKENLLLQARLYGMSIEDTKRASEKLIEIFSLKDCINRMVSTYSGGQRRRLDVALGMVHKPKILFLDEPTTGLDPQNRVNLWNQIKALREEGVAIFLTSHYLDEIDFLADRLAIMDQGKIVEVGSPKALKREISGDIITVGISNSNRQQAVEIMNEQPFVKEIAHEEHKLRLFVEKGDTALPTILRLLDTANIPIESITLAVPTLDDVFLKKTGHALREEN